MELSEATFHTEEFTMVNSVDGVNDLVEKFSGFTSEEVSPTDISVEDNGSISIGSETKITSQEGFKNLCKLVHIPDPFARRIPFDLLQQNITRLLAYRQKDIQVFSSPTNNHWVNFTNPSAWFIEIIPLLEAIQESEDDELSFISGEVSERGVILDFKSDRIAEVQDDLDLGSLTCFGRRFTASESGFGYPISQYMAWRLVCRNGAISPKSFGVVKARNRGEKDAQINSFIRRCFKSNAMLEVYATCYRQIAQDDSHYPDNKQLYRIWNSVRKILGDAEIADDVIGLTPDERSTLRASVKKERLSNELLSDEDSTIPVVKEIPWFRIMNNVTKSSNDVSGTPRNKLQNLGGKILDIAVNSIGLTKIEETNN